jgi:hypothetical protein
MYLKSRKSLLKKPQNQKPRILKKELRGNCRIATMASTPLNLNEMLFNNSKITQNSKFSLKIK